jgi:hypothetical protein
VYGNTDSPYYYSPDGAYFGYGFNPKIFKLLPPLIGSGGTTIPKDSDWVQLSSSPIRGFGILADGSLWGWGAAPLGDGTLNDSTFAKRISREGERWKYVSTCKTHTHAIKEDGSLWSWGSNEGGYLGDGNKTPVGTSAASPIRAFLNAGIASIDATKYPVSRYVHETSNPLLMQPTSVTVEKSYTDDPGSGASVSCEMFYTIQTFYHFRYIPNLQSTPTLEFVADPRDSNAEPASASLAVRVSGNGGVDLLNYTYAKIVSGGRYKYRPTVKIRYTPVGGSEQSITLSNSDFYIETVMVDLDVKVTSSGSGYSHPESTPIKVRATFSNGTSVLLGEAVLAPSGVARLQQYTPWVNLQYPTGRVSIDGGYNFFFGLTPGRTCRAYLISPTDPTIELETREVGFNTRGISPTEIYGRKSCGVIRIEFDSYLEQDPVVYPANSGGRPANTLNPPDVVGVNYQRSQAYISVYGNELTDLYPSGKWSPVHDVYGPTPFSILKCTQPFEETWSDFSNGSVYTSGNGVEFVGGGNSSGGWYYAAGVVYYGGGKPQSPLGLGIGYGWGDTRNNGVLLYPEHKMNVQHPESVAFMQPNNTYNNPFYHTPPASPVQPTIIIEPRDGFGSGLSATAVFTQVPSDTSVSAYNVSFSVTSAGSGYIHEPYVAATTFTLSPVRTGSSSDWVSVVARGGLGSAGLRSDKWPVAWGPINNTIWPEKIGFGLEIKSTTPEPRKQFAGSGEPTLTAAAMKLLVPDVVGFFPKGGNCSEAIANDGSYYFGYGLSTEKYSNTLYMLNYQCPFYRRDPYYWTNRLVSIQGLHNSNVLSRYWGLSAGIYSAKMPTDKATLDLIPPRSSYLTPPYRAFLPQDTPDDLFTPLLIPPHPSTDTKAGTCYTQAPSLGSDYSCKLSAPASFKSLQFQGDMLVGIADNNDLWYLRKHSSQDARRMEAAPVKTETLKSLKLTADVTWEWAIEEWPVSLYYFLGSDTTNTAYKLTDITSKRMSAPTQTIEEGEDNGYEHEIDVVVNEHWTVVITNPGSGYKPGDVLTFTIKEIQGVKFEQQKSFDLVSAEPQSFEDEVLSIKYSGVGSYGSEVPNLQSQWGDPNPWKGKPFKNQMILYVFQHKVTTTKTSKTSSVIKKLKYKLRDEYTPGVFDYADFVASVGGVSSYQYWYQFDYSYRANPYVIADGGVFLTEMTPIPTTLLASQYRSNLLNGNYWERSSFLKKVPTVEVSGGSGSGCTAELVPATGASYGGEFSLPYNTTEAITKNRGSVDCANRTYASSGNSLVSITNPLVSAPASYPTGITSFSSDVGRTSGGDLYFPDHEYTFIGAQAGPLKRPTAIPNLEVTIDNPGEDYQLPPVINVPQPYSDIAVVDAVIDGKLIALGVEYAGTGYRSPPTLTIVGDGNGATAEAVISGPVDSITVSGGGSGYAAAPFATLTGNGSGGTASVSMKGSVSRIAVSAGGSNYSAPPSVTISGDGTGAAATATMKQMVSQILISRRTGKYERVPTVTISGGGGSGATAEVDTEFNATTGLYYVSGVRVTNKGESYTSTVTVTISSEDKASVEAYAVMDKYVDSVEVTSGGSGYSKPPSVQLAGTASASAFLTLHVDSMAVASEGTYRSPPSVSFETVYTVESISLDEPGSGYLTAPDVRIICPRGVGGGATAKCQIKPDGTIKKIVLTSRGSGYIQSSPPVVLFVGGQGHGASATASISALGSGAAATTTINGSILFARAVQPGSRYQFSPEVQITGGGNAAVAALKAKFANGEIDAESYEQQLLATEGRIRARIEGPITQLNIINAGDKYVKPGTRAPDNSTPYGTIDATSLNGVWAQAFCVGVIGSGAPTGWGGNIDFNAPTQYPGGPISQPDSLPTVRFNQKPQIMFWNSVGVFVEGYHACTRTAIGMSSVATKPGPASDASYYAKGTEYLEFVITSGLRIEGGLIGKEWRHYEGGKTIYDYGFQPFFFDEVPKLTYGGTSGTGAVVQSTVGADGKITATNFSSTGTGYNSKSRLFMSRGVLKITPCEASCTVSADGRITSVSITSQGAGYINPAVVIHGGGGTGASANATRLGHPTNPGLMPATSGIESIEITSEGSGYSSDNPPQVFVYDSTGYFTDSPVGQAVAESLNGWAYKFGGQYGYGGLYVVQWSSENSEYCPTVPHEFKGTEPAGPWIDSYFNNYGYPDSPLFRRFPIVESRFYYGYTSVYYEYFRGFGVADYVTDLFNTTNSSLLRKPHSSAPAITVSGSCRTPLRLSSRLAKWDGVSVVDAVVSAIRTDR